MRAIGRMDEPAMQQSLDEVTPYKTGICLAGIKNPAAEALQYLLTHVNSLQSSFEFELISIAPNEPLTAKLLSKRPVVVNDNFNQLVGEFAEIQDNYSAMEAACYKLPKQPCDYYTIVSLARLDNGYYAWGGPRTNLVALGNWKRTMAPPSLVEFALTLVIRLAALDAAPDVGDTRHLGTKGCLFDFNARLSTVRLKVLNGFVCTSCEQAIIAAGYPHVVDDLRIVLDKSWFGDDTSPLTPAGICRKLGYPLFLTKGIKPTLMEGISAKLQNDLVAEVVKIIGAILIAYLLIRLGLKVIS